MFCVTFVASNNIKSVKFLEIKAMIAFIWTRCKLCFNLNEFKCLIDEWFEE